MEEADLTGTLRRALDMALAGWGMIGLYDATEAAARAAIEAE